MAVYDGPLDTRVLVGGVVLLGLLVALWFVPRRSVGSPYCKSRYARATTAADSVIVDAIVIKIGRGSPSYSTCRALRLQPADSTR